MEKVHPPLAGKQLVQLSVNGGVMDELEAEGRTFACTVFQRFTFIGVTGAPSTTVPKESVLGTKAASRITGGVVKLSMAPIAEPMAFDASRR
jgi:hypothetical protein